MTDRKYRQRGYQDSTPSTSRGGAGGFDAPSRIEGAPRGRSAGRPSEEVFRCKACGERSDAEILPGVVCRKCGAPLRACVQCRHFDSAAPNQCRAPIETPVAAKSRENACRLYEPAIAMDLTGRKTAETPDAARAAFDRLFGKK